MTSLKDLLPANFKFLTASSTYWTLDQWLIAAALTAGLLVALLFLLAKLAELLVTTTRPSWQDGMHDTYGSKAPSIQRRETKTTQGPDGAEHHVSSNRWIRSRFFFDRHRRILWVKPRKGYGKDEIDAQRDQYSLEFLPPGEVFGGVERVPSRLLNFLGWKFFVYVDPTTRPVKQARVKRAAEKKDG